MIIAILRRCLWHRSIILVVGLVALLTGPDHARCQWIRAQGQGGQQVFCFAISGQYLFAGTDDGVIRSSDNGVTWIATNDDSILGYVTNFAVVGHTLFAGCQRGIFFTTNDGTSWAMTKPEQTDTLRTGLVAAVKDLYAFDGGFFVPGLFLSTDSGAHWARVHNPITDSQWISSAGSFDSTIFVYSGAGFYRSTDQGTSWQASDSGMENRGVGVLKQEGSNLFAGTNSGLYISKDGGHYWSLLSRRLASLSISNIAVSGNTIVLISDSGIYHSTDFGISWKRFNDTIGFWLSYGPTSVYASGTNFVIGGQYGVWLSTDSGDSWRSLNVGVIGNPFLSTDVGAGVSGLLASNDSEIFAGNLFASSDLGITWHFAGIGGYGGAYTFCLEASGDSLFIGSEDSILFSPDGGASWYGRDLPNVWIQTMDMRGQTLLVGAGRIYRSSNAGLSWQKSDAGLLDTFVSVLGHIGETWFAGATNLLSVPPGNTGPRIYRSTDDGFNWSRISIGPEGSSVRGFAVRSNQIFAAMDTAIWVSSDSGQTWSDVLPGFSFIPEFTSIAVLDTDLLVGTQRQGIFLLTRNGTSWNARSLGLYNVYAISVTRSNVFADDGSGIWRRPVGEILGLSSVRPSYLPEPPSIMTFFPNPVTSVASADLDVPSSCFAEVEIVNALGTPVSQLFRGALEPGEHVFPWNSSQVPAGAYWCVVSSNGRLLARVAVSVEK
jgi:photosystem II stability/assembly factor-like uncharacterized protein